ncbi:hypothetical protein K1719_031927 [Acacia pycnantha]|nr:hypothetical protein K1719_031927 [Acacia pycnantha]
MLIAAGEEWSKRSIRMEIQILNLLVRREADTERILISKVLSNKTYTRAALESILRKAWNLPEGFDVIEINGNAFMFKFSDGEEFNRILQVWIQMHNVPMEGLRLENVVTIGGYVGEVLLVEAPCYNGRYLHGFLCTRVLLDLKKPLAFGFWMPRSDGRKVWISIQYEKLQCFYYNCGRIEHDNRSGKSEKMMLMFNPKEPRFGAWLTTNACRSWDEVMAVIRSDWSKSEYARKKKEEAIMRRNEEIKRKATVAPNTEDDDLFFIRMHKILVENKGWEQKESTRRGISSVEEASNADWTCLKVNAKGNDVHNSEDKGKDRQACVNEEDVARATTKISVEVDRPKAERTTCRIAKAYASQKENSMAMVLYDGKILGDVINRINDLGLKINAEEEWETSKAKRLKMVEVDSDPKPAISIYANNL